MAIDPVCKMEVDAAQAAGQSEYGGTTYYFCSTACKNAFDQEPQRFAS
ncbi:MAG: YHS domain-containing protein [Dehalococcoidia bacterium]|nr:YHS domain-containing protein [Dehalococcoidia bacterium]